MSVCVDIAQLTREQVVDIRKSLSIRPMKMETRIPRKDGRGSFPKQVLVENKEMMPVEFMKVEGGRLRLPFAFALELLDCDPIPVPHMDTLFDFKGDLRPHQESIVKEAQDHLTTKRSTGLYVYTGVGKTCMAAYLSACFPWVVCIIVHRNFLLEQWRNTFTTLTTAQKIWVVGVDPQPDTVPQILIVMDGQMEKIPSEWRRKVGTLILDEAHCLCTASRVSALLELNPEIVIACTATPQRADNMHRMLDLMVGSDTGVVRKSSQQLQVVHVNTGISPPSRNTEQGRLDWSALVSELSGDEHRNGLIIHLTQQLVKEQDRKLLILTNLTQHVRSLVDALREIGISSDSMAGTKKKYTDGQVLVGTFSKISLAFDQQTASSNFDGRRLDTLILAISVKDLAKLEQSVGRILRCHADRNPTVYYLVDDHPVIRKHWNICRNWFLSREGAKATDITALDIAYGKE